MRKKGLSPVIATVLLVSVVVVIGVVVFMWFRGISEEAITKFDGTNVQLVCEEVYFEASYAGGSIYLSNTGQVPIYKMKAKVTSAGAYSTIFLEEGWPEVGINQGGAYAGTLAAGSGDTILLIPVLVGSTSEGEKAYTCEESQGVEIVIP